MRGISVPVTDLISSLVYNDRILNTYFSSGRINLKTLYRKIIKIIC